MEYGYFALSRLSTWICVLVLSIISFEISAQDTQELKKRLKSQKNDTTRVILLNQLGKSYFESNPDSAIKICQSARLLAENLDFKSGQALALKNIGIVYYLQGKYIDAIKTWEEAIKIFQAIGDKRGVANILGNQASVYFNQGDEAKSLELDLKSLQISESINDTLRIVTSLNNIGTVYLNKPATYDKALTYFLRSYDLSKAIQDKYLMGTAAVNLGEIYYKKNADTTALRYLKEAHKAYDGTEDLPYALNYLGRVYCRQKDFAESIRNHKKAYDFAKKLDTRLDMTQSLVGLGQAYLSMGDPHSAKGYFKEAIQIGIPLKATTEIKDAYEGLTKVYSKIGDFANAFTYQNLLLAIKDTIYNINTDKKLGTLQFNFDLEKKESQINLLTKDKEIQNKELERQKLVRNSFIGGFAIVLLFASVVFAQRNKISKEKKRSDELLMNILPEETAEELKRTGTAKTQTFESVSVMFTDFKNFTQASEQLTPEELVAEINNCFSAFDRIIIKYGIEKIKTIGDAYMCAGGLPVLNQTHPIDVIHAGLEIAQFIEENKQERIRKGQPFFDIRIGIHTGPVVAGIVGIKKFAYDIWGDTVNTASRMESSGQAGKVNISESTYALVKHKFLCTHRGKIEAKNKGLIDMYFVDGQI